ncbi:hypothetical protein PLICRDRAFT_171557 [Plicaturopsis crispa FD-325 SS-3]|nr:hypothetical protein PLICRDRAFT_171557 [Plicaturopsis crispa FD-325 SS-3]
MTFKISISPAVAEFIWRNRALGCYSQVEGKYLTDEEYREHTEYLVQREIPVELDAHSRFYQIEKAEHEVFSPMWHITSKDLLRDYRPIGVGDHVVGLISGNMQGALSGDIANQTTTCPGTVVFKWVLDEDFHGALVHFLTFHFERPVNMDRGDEDSQLRPNNDSQLEEHGDKELYKSLTPVIRTQGV